MSSDPTAVEVFAEGNRMRGVARHGNTPFDVPLMSQADGNLWWGGHPYSEFVLPTLPGYFDHLVSLYPWGRWQFDHDMKGELYVQMLDDVNQDLDSVWHIAEMVRQFSSQGPTYVHCQCGLNRSSFVVAATLYLGGSWCGSQILDHLRSVRGPAVLCNPAFEAEVLSWQ